MLRKCRPDGVCFLSAFPDTGNRIPGSHRKVNNEDPPVHLASEGYLQTNQFLLDHVVGNAEGDAQIVLGVGGVVGEAGADVVHLQRAHAEAPAQSHIQATAQLQGEGVGGGTTPPGEGKELLKAWVPPNNASPKRCVLCPRVEMPL